MSAARNDHRISRVLDITHHRNGVAGAPFFVVRFTADMEDYADSWSCHTFIATLFPEYVEEDAFGPDEYLWGPVRGQFYNPRCAVLDADMVGQGIIAFGENSWRGDRFADELLAAVNEWSKLTWQAACARPDDAAN